MQILEIIRKMNMEIQKKIWTSRYNEMGSGPPGKSQVIWVFVGNVQQRVTKVDLLLSIITGLR